MSKEIKFNLYSWRIEKTSRGCRLYLHWRSGEKTSIYSDDELKQEEHIEFKNIEDAVAHLKTKI